MRDLDSLNIEDKGDCSSLLSFAFINLLWSDLSKASSVAHRSLNLSLREIFIAIHDEKINDHPWNHWISLDFSVLLKEELAFRNNVDCIPSGTSRINRVNLSQGPIAHTRNSNDHWRPMSDYVARWRSWRMQIVAHTLADACSTSTIRRWDRKSVV